MLSHVRLEGLLGDVGLEDPHGVVAGTIARVLLGLLLAPNSWHYLTKYVPLIAYATNGRHLLH